MEAVTHLNYYILWIHICCSILLQINILFHIECDLYGYIPLTYHLIGSSYLYKLFTIVKSSSKLSTEVLSTWKHVFHTNMSGDAIS